MSRGRRSELLALATTEALMTIADRCLDGQPDPIIVSGPEVGTVALTVREPVEATRFQLADVHVTRSMVEHQATRGWSMRLGDDRAGSLAAAICDAEVEAGGPEASAVLELCRCIEDEQLTARRDEWAQLEPTIVHFEEMAE